MGIMQCYTDLSTGHGLRPNVPAQTTPEYWKQNMYLSCIEELHRRTAHPSASVRPTQTHHLTDANVQGIFTNFEGDLSDF